MQYLDRTRVFPSATGTPANLSIFADDVSGAGAIASCVRALLAGELVSLVSCNHPTVSDEPGKIHSYLRLKMAEIDRVKCPRHVGENDDPEGPGSHSLIASWYGEKCTDPVAIAATIALYLRGACVFRLIP